ncbi:MAG: hypothetical protein WA160_01375 [Pseudobdellovibrio sp.]
MKNLLVIAVALASVNAFATRARVNSLGNSVHLTDANNVYTNPADMFIVGGDYVVLESGNTKSTATSGVSNYDGAEGMVVRSMGDAKMGLAIGHDSELGLKIRSLALANFGAAVNYFQQNPLELSYGMKSGDLSWAGTLIYSNYQSKTGINEKENTMGVRFGMHTGNYDASLGLGLANTYQNDTNGKFTGTLGLTAAGGMWMDTIYLKGKIETAGYKVESAAGAEVAKVSGNTLTISATDSRKKDGNEFFYGAGLTSYSQKDDAGTQVKVDKLSLPVIIGFEQKANTWMTLRGSVTQTVLINNSKVSTSTATVTEASPDANNVVVAVGTGFNFDKVNVDATLKGLTTSAGSANQQLDGNNLLAQVGLNYMF